MSNQSSVKNTQSSVKIILVADLAISDHDGYCSGNECELVERTVEKEILASPEIMKMSSADLQYNYEHLFDNPIPKRYYSQTFYCSTDQNAIDLGLQQHDFKYSNFRIKTLGSS